MTAPPRPDVAEALTAARWTPEHRPGGVHRHRHDSGAVLALFSAADGILHGPGPLTAAVTFAAETPDAVVIAACLAASGQLDPARDMRRSDWLGWLEAAGVDSWEGHDAAIDMRDRHDRDQA